jgi:hypothetical protein
LPKKVSSKTFFHLGRRRKSEGDGEKILSAKYFSAKRNTIIIYATQRGVKKADVIFSHLHSCDFFYRDESDKIDKKTWQV